MKELKLTDGTIRNITIEQADKIIEESASGKAGIVVDNEYIAFKAIYKITDSSSSSLDWNKSPHNILPPATKTSRYDLWMEATKRNRDRIKKGIQPYANWRVTTEGELIEDPEYYKTKVTVLSDYR